MKTKLLACTVSILGISLMSYGLSFKISDDESSYNDRIVFDLVLAPNFNVEGAALTNPDFYHNIYPTINNPILSGKNIYAPDILTSSCNIYCYYGGWLNESDINDRIYLSITDNLDPSGTWIFNKIIIDHGEYIHVNDPSVVKVNATSFFMVYTVGDNDNNGIYKEEIHWAESTNRIEWTPSTASESYLVNLTDPNSIAHNAIPSGAITDYARPSLLYEDGNWIMYFDAKIDKDTQNPKRHWTFRAVDSDGDDEPDDFTVTHYLGLHDTGAWPKLLEADVYKHTDGKYYAVYRSNNWEIWQAESNDGITWSNHVVRVKHDPPNWPYYHPNYPDSTNGGFSNPSWFFNENSQRMDGIAYGITYDPDSDNGPTDHDIGFAFNQYKIRVHSSSFVDDDGNTVNSTWHVHGKSKNQPIFHLYIPDVRYTSFDKVQLIDPVDGEILVNQTLTFNKGDILKLVP